MTSKNRTRRKPGMIASDPNVKAHKHWGASHTARRFMLNDAFGYAKNGKEFDVVDSNTNLNLNPIIEDVLKAKPNPLECMWCQCIMRQYKSKAALILRTLAYVLIEQDGKRVIGRFFLSAAARRMTMQMDLPTVIGNLKEKGITLDAIKVAEKMGPRKRQSSNPKAAPKHTPIATLVVDSGGQVTPALNLKPVILFSPGPGHSLKGCAERARRYKTQEYQAEKAIRERKGGKRQKKKEYDPIANGFAEFRNGALAEMARQKTT